MNEIHKMFDDFAKKSFNRIDLKSKCIRWIIVKCDFFLINKDFWIQLFKLLQITSSFYIFFMIDNCSFFNDEKNNFSLFFSKSS